MNKIQLAEDTAKDPLDTLVKHDLLLKRVKELLIKRYKALLVDFGKLNIAIFADIGRLDSVRLGGNDKLCFHRSFEKRL